MTRKIEIVRLALAGFALLASLGGCALTPPVTLVKDPHRLASIAEAPTAVEKDRRAILAMLAGTLVREFGFNDYRRITGFDFTPAYRYWGATKDYWARVRAQWEAQLAAAGGLRLKTEVDGMPVIEALFSQAGTVQKGGTVSNEELEAVFVQWVETSVKAVSDASGAGLDPQR